MGEPRRAEVPTVGLLVRSSARRTGIGFGRTAANARRGPTLGVNPRAGLAGGVGRTRLPAGGRRDRPPDGHHAQRSPRTPGRRTRTAVPGHRPGVQRAAERRPAGPAAAPGPAVGGRAGDRRRQHGRHVTPSPGRDGRGEPAVQPGHRRGHADRVPVRGPARVRHRRAGRRRRPAPAGGGAAAGRPPDPVGGRPGRRVAVPGRRAVPAVGRPHGRHPPAGLADPAPVRAADHRLHERVPGGQPAGDPGVRPLVPRGLPRAGGDPSPAPGRVRRAGVGRPHATAAGRHDQHPAHAGRVLRAQGRPGPSAGRGPRPVADGQGDRGRDRTSGGRTCRT